jgi:transposase
MPTLTPLASVSVDVPVRRVLDSVLDTRPQDLRTALLNRGCCKTQGTNWTRVGHSLETITGMSYAIEANYEKQWLFPPSLEDLLGADHPARMVREFVDAQDLETLGFKIPIAEDGRPPYSASLQLKVWLYGYMTKNRVTRGLERACMDQMGMLWLTGMTRPDHTTLWRFWRDNKKPIRKVFKQLLQVASGMNLVGLALHAVDGTKIFSQASEQHGWHRAPLEKKLALLDAAIDEIMKQTEQAEAAPSPECRLPERLQRKELLREKVREQLHQLNQKERDHLHTGDEDARVMKCRTGNRFAYNAQAVVDHESKLIVAADVVTDESDNYQLVPMIEQVVDNLGKAADLTVADAGYQAATGLAEAEDKGHDVLVNQIEPRKDQPYHALHFRYEEETDQCVCPRGEVLNFECTRQRDKVQPYTVRIYRCGSFENCPVRWQCSSSKTGRTLQIHPNYSSVMRQREKLKDPAMRALLKKRSTTVEPVFGWGKEVLGFRRWTVRGLEKVRTQWALVCTAMNLLRLHKYWIAGKLSFA